MKKILFLLKLTGIWIISILGISLGIINLTESFTILSILLSVFFIILSLIILPFLWQFVNKFIKIKLFVIIYSVSFVLMFIVDHGTRPPERFAPLFVTTNSVNVRAKASTNSTVLFKLNKDDSLNVLKDTVEWYLISCQRGTGFISKYYTSESNPLKEKHSSIFYIEISLLFILVIFLIIILKPSKPITDTYIPAKSNSTSRKKIQYTPRTTITNKSLVTREERHTSISKTEKEVQTCISNTEKEKQTSITKPIINYHISIVNGKVYLGKEKSSMRELIFSYGEAIDCNLEDETNEYSRFLVVTEKGEVRLCKLKTTQRLVVFKPWVSFGSAYKAKFSGNDSFTFDTEKGMYKGYFKSSRIELLRKK